MGKIVFFHEMIKLFFFFGFFCINTFGFGILTSFVKTLAKISSD